MYSLPGLERSLVVTALAWTETLRGKLATGANKTRLSARYIDIQLAYTRDTNAWASSLPHGESRVSDLHADWGRLGH